MQKNSVKKVDTLQSVELGDGVEILLRVAGPLVRSMALLIDYILITGTLIILSILFYILAIGVSENVAYGLLLLGLFFLSWGYFTFFEAGKRAATPGKRSMGIRVVDRSGNTATLGQVTIRNILRFVDMLPGIPSAAAGIFIGGYGIGLTACLLSEKFQRVGDLVANTVVIYTRPINYQSAPIAISVDKVMPSIKLNREEQAALVAYRERAGLWSEERRIELCSHAKELTNADGKIAEVRILEMARWLVEGK